MDQRDGKVGLDSRCIGKGLQGKGVYVCSRVLWVRARKCHQ